jgi:hypothetical protein
MLTPFALPELQSNIQKANFISVMTDASNHKDTIFPVLVRYFEPSKGVQVTLLELKSLPGERAETVSEFLTNCLSSVNARDKTVSICADNTNCNFGGASRKCVNNVFIKLKESIGHDLVGVGCSLHIIHNTIQTATDVLPVDIEGIVSRICSYFYLYTVRVENLKELCEFVNQEYKKILVYSKQDGLPYSPLLNGF